MNPNGDPIHKTPDGANIPTSARTTWVRCGNCKKQYEVPIEQPFRYYCVQQHKFACTAGSKEIVDKQHAQLMWQFRAQQAAQQQTRRRPWWKFWRRGQ